MAQDRTAYVREGSEGVEVIKMKGDQLVSRKVISKQSGLERHERNALAKQLERQGYNLQ